MEPQMGVAEGFHGEQRGDHGDQQRGERHDQFVMNGNGRLKGQHADEVGGPDATRQATGTEPAPAATSGRVFDVADPLGHIKGAKTRRTRDQVGQQNQEGVMTAIE